MKQREVQDDENITWTCVQPFTGGASEAAEAAAEKLESGDGKVPVVCTPSGGRQSVRMELVKDWAERMSDDELLAAIRKAG
jgi:hypothetical protein